MHGKAYSLVAIDEGDLQALAEIAAITARDHWSFRIIIPGIVQIYIADYADPAVLREERRRMANSFSKIERLSADLINAINELHVDDYIMFGAYHRSKQGKAPAKRDNEIKQRVFDVVHSTTDSNEFLSDAATLTHGVEAVRNAVAVYKTIFGKKTHGGAPSKMPDPLVPISDPFDSLVMMLMDTVLDHGGDLVAYKGENTGSLNAFLDVIRPYAPEGLIPLYQQDGSGKIPKQARLARIALLAKKKNRQWSERTKTAGKTGPISVLD